ncbi:hypothetical protein [Burkholderia sp. Bp8963]|uniref:hypothetical protein n=1 Tax=Burkholderia sp. Bp8963 TaxID=2184547 RepID=UPI000F5A1242|nr:hypothetical protein [Burkholderia sp. Bp8963]
MSNVQRVHSAGSCRARGRHNHTNFTVQASYFLRKNWRFCHKNQYQSKAYRIAPRTNDEELLSLTARHSSVVHRHNLHGKYDNPFYGTPGSTSWQPDSNSLI